MSNLEQHRGSVYMLDNTVWRDEELLIMDKEGELPDRCLKCNIPTKGNRLSHKYSWHHPAINLLILVNILFFWIVRMVYRKTARVEIGLCETHREKWRAAIIGKRAMVLIGVIGLILGVLGIHPLTNVLLGLGFIFAGVIYGNNHSNVATVSKIDDRFIYLEGADEAYLNSLPSRSREED